MFKITKCLTLLAHAQKTSPKMAHLSISYIEVSLNALQTAENTLTKGMCKCNHVNFLQTLPFIQSCLQGSDGRQILTTPCYTMKRTNKACI